MTKGKKREATPRSPKVSLAAVDAPPAPIPEELETLWDEAVAKDFAALTKEQQDFLLHYFRTGDPGESYRKGYNRPLASNHLASNSAYQVLEGIGVQGIVKKIQAQRAGDLFLVIDGYREMAKATKPNWVQDKNGQWENVGDDPDWTARDKAFLGIRKVRGLDEADKVEHSGQIATTHKYDIPNKRPVGT